MPRQNCTERGRNTHCETSSRRWLVLPSTLARACRGARADGAVLVAALPPRSLGGAPSAHPSLTRRIRRNIGKTKNNMHAAAGHTRLLCSTNRAGHQGLDVGRAHGEHLLISTFCISNPTAVGVCTPCASSHEHWAHPKNARTGTRRSSHRASSDVPRGGRLSHCDLGLQPVGLRVVQHWGVLV